MKIDQLLSELDQLNHSQCWTRLVDLTKSTERENLDSLQNELESGDWYHQLTSLRMSIVTRNENRTFKALESTSRTVRLIAANALPRYCTDQSRLSAYLLNAPANLRMSFLKAIGCSSRPGFADELVPHVKKFGPKAVSHLLPACRQEVVKENLLACEPHIRTWKKLASRHPKLVLEYMSECFEKEIVQRRRFLWPRFANCIDAFEASVKAEFYELILKYCDSFDELPDLIQSRVVREYQHAPQLCAKIIFNQKSMSRYKKRIPSSLVVRSEHLKNEHLQPLVNELLPNSIVLVYLMSSLPWPRRRELVETALSQGIQCDWSPRFLKAMPWEIRNREARRVLDSKKQLAYITRLAYLELVLYEEAVPDLETSFRGTRAEDRALAYASLIRCADYNNQIADALPVLLRTKNDQDPVRQKFFLELAAVSPSKYDLDRDLPTIESLIDAALQAPDVSTTSLEFASRLMVKLLTKSETRNQIDRILSTLAKIAAQRDGFLLQSGYCAGSQLSNLRKGLEHDLVDAVAEVLKTQNQLGRYSATLHLAGRLGTRGWEVPKLQELLQQTLSAHDASTRSRAVALWLDNPKTRDSRIEQLLQDDPSVITQHGVFFHLHRRRQDLLDPYLDGSTKAGKFLSGKRIYLLPAHSGFDRWVPRQQKAFKSKLDRWVNRKSANANEKRWGLRARAAMQVSRLEDFDKWISSKDRSTLEAALAALPCLDHVGCGIETLLKHLDGDTAKVAMYALPRCVNELPSDEQFQFVDSLLERDYVKVTVLKEAIRLLGRFPGEQSVDALCRVVEKEKIHRDVKIAVGHAACRLLDDERTWDILKWIADDERVDVVNSLILATPYAMNTEQRKRFVQLILPLAAHPNSKVRGYFFAYGFPWQQSAGVEFAKAARNSIVAVDDSPEWEGAASLITYAVTQSTGAIILETCRDLLQAKDDDFNAKKERDLPSLRRMDHIAQSLMRQVGLEPVRVVLKDLAELCAEDPRTQSLSMRYAISALDWSTTEVVDSLKKIASRFENQPHLIQTFCLHLRTKPGVEDSFNKMATKILKQFLRSESPSERIVGLFMLEQIGPELGWPEKHRKALRKLRVDKDPLVQQLAFEIFTAPESVHGAFPGRR